MQLGSGSFGTVIDLGNSVSKSYQDLTESYYEELNGYVLKGSSRVIQLLYRDGNNLVFNKYYPLNTNRPISEMFVQLCLALNDFYINNLSHQDIAPRNILQDANQVPVFIDIGGTTRFGFDVGLIREYPGHKLSYNVGYAQDILLLGRTLFQIYPNIPSPYYELALSMIQDNIMLRPTVQQILDTLRVPYPKKKRYPSINSYLKGSVDTSRYNQIISNLRINNPQILGTLYRLIFVLCSRNISTNEILALCSFVHSYITRASSFDDANLNVKYLADIDFPSNPYWYDAGQSKYWLPIVKLDPLAKIAREALIQDIQVQNINSYTMRTYKLIINNAPYSIETDTYGYVGIVKFSNLLYPKYVLDVVGANNSKYDYLLIPDRIYLEGLIMEYDRKRISIVSNNEFKAIFKIASYLKITYLLYCLVGTGANISNVFDN